MKLHPNARTTPYAREQIVDRVLRLGWSVEDAAQAAAVSVRTAYRWMARYRAEGVPGLQDRTCTPRRIVHRTSTRRVERIEQLRRRQRRTAAQIAQRLGMPRSTVAAVLKRRGLERECELACAPLFSGGRGSWREPEPPQELAAGPAERVARTRYDERLENWTIDENALRKVVNAPERASIGALGYHHRSWSLPHATDKAQTNADCSVFEHAGHLASVHVRWEHLDVASLSVPHEARRRIEPHGLCVEECTQKLGRVVVA